MQKRITLLLALVAIGCGVTVPIAVRQLQPATAAASLDHQSPYLKAHLRNGDLYVLSGWSVDEAQRVVTGRGEHLDINRTAIERGDALRVPLDDVVLFETNVLQKSKRIQSLSIMTGVTAAVTAGCLAAPKACFGSCPTFYAADGSVDRLQAEGFSSSILPSLERRDIDALYRTSPHGGRLELRMTNEAQETHVIRHVRVLAAPRPRGARVYATDDGTFWRSDEAIAPAHCAATDGDCTAALESFDAVEHFTQADAHNLARRESIELRYRGVHGSRRGLVIAARQTLLSTFLLYQAFAYLGSTSGDRLAELERRSDEVTRRAGGIAEQLGGIDVSIARGGKWVKAGEYHETGPLATDVHVVPLPDGAGDVSVRLEMTKGLWRLDAVMLASLDESVVPLSLEPADVRSRTVAIDAQALFREPLVTLPGDEYTFGFTLPSDDYELFLDTRGYYLEWMRNEWLRDESRVRAAMMVFAPRLALRLLAPEFKKIEASMEKQFWSSRYAIH